MKVVSGGQTGVDRAALDAAMARGMAVGGWCPAGRKAEDGTIPGRYPLTETPFADYAGRTDWNVRDSDATLVLLRSRPPQGGSLLTLQCAKERGKPSCVASVDELTAGDEVAEWLRSHGVETLNVAGPRESEEPGVYQLAIVFLRRLFSNLP
jgi:hypothetical protein